MPLRHPSSIQGFLVPGSGLRRTSSLPCAFLGSSIGKLEKKGAQFSGHVELPEACIPKSTSSVFDFEMDALRNASAGKACELAARGPPVIERSFSDLQDYHSHQSQHHVLWDSPVRQMIDACRTSCSFEQQLAAHVKNAVSRAGAQDSVSVSALATELLAQGYMVQIRNGYHEQHSSSNNNCLKNLQHQFLTCTGYQEGSQTAELVDPTYLLEPLVVEPRFRDQFVIQFGTSAPTYDALLAATSPIFVGSLARLEAAVTVLCQEVGSVFKHQGRPLPPWRTKQAMMSKWAPDQLRELSRLLAHSKAACPPLVPAAAAHGWRGGIADLTVTVLEQDQLAVGHVMMMAGSGQQQHQAISAAAKQFCHQSVVVQQGSIAARAQQENMQCQQQTEQSDRHGVAWQSPCSTAAVHTSLLALMPEPLRPKPKQRRTTSPLHINRINSGDLRAMASKDKRAKSALAAALKRNSGTREETRRVACGDHVVAAQGFSRLVEMASAHGDAARSSIHPLPRAAGVATGGTSAANVTSACGVRVGNRTVIQEPWTRINKVKWGSGQPPRPREPVGADAAMHAVSAVAAAVDAEK